MTKVFCDICKKEIECDSEASEYKMKRLTHSSTKAGGYA